MRIGELAKATNCSVETIRYYEQQGLIPAAYRTDNNYRTYNQTHLNRLKFIRNCRSLDMTHEEIRELLRLLETPQKDCQPIAYLLDEHINHVTTRLKELQELQKQLTALRQHCEGPSGIDQCGMIQELTDMETSNLKPKTHLG